ncbi:MAG: phosphogluconate dehydratase [Robiginitomaculum sp.]|nr:MAG: phosphogluconate dehydratase [Robiginitomaculum sp.]
MVHSILQEVTARIAARSTKSRQAYLDQMHRAAEAEPHRSHLSCGNLAHGIAACEDPDKAALANSNAPNIAIISAYNDMLSAHQPFGEFPPLIKKALHEMGAVGQMAGGVPAMCDGITQGRAGMELSLFSRDTIAMASAIALSHDMFDGAILLGVCDKIVPGLLIGALRFGHLPFVLAPAGPMPSGLPNEEKTRIRKLYAEGKVGRDELLAAESQSYHAPGTCTFYGTANSNQMLMEIMGLHLPGAAFVNPGTPLRDALTGAAAQRAAQITALGNAYTPICEVIDERAIVNAIVGLNATGGSTNHTIHIVAIARAAGLIVNWDDFDALSTITPLLCRIYPNGPADVNQFQAAGGLGFVIAELLRAGLLHEDVTTIAGGGLTAYTQEPYLDGDALKWRDGVSHPGNPDIVGTTKDPISKNGGLKVLQGNLGRAVIKVSAVAPEHHIIEAPALCFSSQEALMDSFAKGELERDLVAVVRFQGPRANGMPELHRLTPPLSILQDRGFKVALVTDGRMSGASGRVPAAIHLSPEALCDGAIAKIRDGDLIRLDAKSGTLNALVDMQEFDAREPVIADLDGHQSGMGRELFSGMRAQVTSAENGALSFGWNDTL